MEHQKKITGLISLASYLFSVIFIAIGFFVGLRGAKTMEIFDKFPGLITPVKYVVWIWIPIWLLLGVLCTISTVHSTQKRSSKLL